MQRSTPSGAANQPSPIRRAAVLPRHVSTRGGSNRNSAPAGAATLPIHSELRCAAYNTSPCTRSVRYYISRCDVSSAVPPRKRIRRTFQEVAAPAGLATQAVFRAVATRSYDEPREAPGDSTAPQPESSLRKRTPCQQERRCQSSPLSSEPRQTAHKINPCSMRRAAASRSATAPRKYARQLRQSNRRGAAEPRMPPR